MTDNKKMFYKMYKQTALNNKQGFTTTVEEMCKLHIPGITEEEIKQYKKDIEYINVVCDGNNWTLGTELEFGGYNNRLKYDRNEEEEIIDTIKGDCSVSGDGTEYNLKPTTIKEFKTKEYKQKLESFCFRAVNNDCRIVRSAGEHFHYRWDEAEYILGAMFKSILSSSSSVSHYYNRDEYQITRLEDFLENKIEKGEYYKETYIEIPLLNFSYDDGKRLKKNKDELKLNRKVSWSVERNDYAEEFTKMMYEARQWLYCTSNRAGTESYGLAADGTRGWDRHDTIEIRCWRTTTDFRSIIARGIVGKFFLNWVLKKALLDNKGYLTPQEESIWKDMDDETRKCFSYLAFHTNNSHGTALKTPDICSKLGVSEAFARAIKCRTSVYQKSLLRGSVDRKVKDLINELGE